MPTTPNRPGSPALPPLYACEYCGTAVSPTAPGVWRKVTGWVENRKGGGAHSIAFPSAPHGWACHICMMDRRHGVNKDQTSLF